MKAAYICDSCSRISTITSQFARCDYCGSATHISPEDAMEILVPKDEFGTELLAVVHRGKVVDLLLQSDRTSIIRYISYELVRVQEYIDNLGRADETCAPTDIEVRHGNNVYLVRFTYGLPHILIPAISTEEALGDIYLTPSEQESILALARSAPSSSENEGIIEIAMARKQKSETLQPTACDHVELPPVSLSSTDEDEGFVIYAHDPQSFPDAKWRGEKQAVDQASNQQEAEYLVREYQIAYGRNMRVWFENTRPEGFPISLARDEQCGRNAANIHPLD
jgi:hypothetical protein